MIAKRPARRRTSRRGYTILETTVALGLLSAAGVAVAQLGLWAIAERARTDERHTVIEEAANILERARARNFEQLDAAWASSVRLPNWMTERMNQTAVAVTVTPEADRVDVKRVTVEITWKGRTGTAVSPVKLIGLFARRSGGGRP